jgi:hypothetical protein
MLKCCLQTKNYGMFDEVNQDFEKYKIRPNKFVLELYREFLLETSEKLQENDKEEIKN